MYDDASIQNSDNSVIEPNEELVEDSQDKMVQRSHINSEKEATSLPDSLKIWRPRSFKFNKTGTKYLN